MLDRIINVQLLGHPLNWVIVALMVIAMWFGAFVIASKLGIAAPSSDDA
jgi:hypothetical protein